MQKLLTCKNDENRGVETFIPRRNVIFCNVTFLSLCRVRKLKETLVTVQQLDKNMSNLRTWLSRIEAELAKPVVYNVCHSDEIQRKLAEQQVGRSDSCFNEVFVQDNIQS